MAHVRAAPQPVYCPSPCLRVSAGPGPGQRRLLNLKDSFTSWSQDQDTQLGGERCPGCQVSCKGTHCPSGQPGGTVDPGNLDPAKAEYTMHTGNNRDTGDWPYQWCGNNVSPPLLTWAPHPWPSGADITSQHHNGEVEIEILISCAIFLGWPSAGHRDSACTNFHSDHSGPKLHVIKHNFGCIIWCLSKKITKE